MMACYIDEEEVWKCPKHPSKRRRNGICPTCLRDRLVNLCPDCAKVRPCACVSTTSSSSSSSSSSFSFLNGRGGGGGGGGSVGGRVSNLIDGEPSLRRSRSLAVPFLRSKNSPGSDSIKTPSFWSVLKRSKTKRSEPTKENEAVNHNNHNDENMESNNKIDDFARMMMRSRSVSAGTKMTSAFGRDDVRSAASVKRKSWYFPSPMQVFRSIKTPKVINNARSPLPRGWFLFFFLFFSPKSTVNWYGLMFWLSSNITLSKILICTEVEDYKSSIHLIDKR